MDMKRYNFILMFNVSISTVSTLHIHLSDLSAVYLHSDIHSWLNNCAKRQHLASVNKPNSPVAVTRSIQELKVKLWPSLFIV